MSNAETPNQRRYRLYAANPEKPIAELALLDGCTPEAFAKSMSRDKFRERLARERLGPITAVDPATHAVAQVEAWLAGLTPDAMEAVDVARILEAVRTVRAGTVTSKPSPWTEAARTDFLRAITSALPPIDEACPCDLRRLTFAQMEVFLWLFERACGSAHPFRDPGYVAPGSPAVAEPDYEQTSGVGQ